MGCRPGHVHCASALTLVAVVARLGLALQRSARRPMAGPDHACEARLSAGHATSSMALDGLAADHQGRHRSGCERLDLLETKPARPLLDLRHLPWIAAAAHGPKYPQSFAERIGLRWKQGRAPASRLGRARDTRSPSPQSAISRGRNGDGYQTTVNASLSSRSTMLCVHSAAGNGRDVPGADFRPEAGSRRFTREYLRYEVPRHRGP